MKVTMSACGLVLLLMVGACGGGDGDDDAAKPSGSSTTAAPSAPTSPDIGQADLPKAIEAGLIEGFTVSEEVAECVAGRLIAGAFSNDALQAMADGSREFPPAEAEAFGAELIDGIKECDGRLRNRISAGLMEGFKLQKAKADCVAERLVRSELDPRVLVAIAGDSNDLTPADGPAVRDEISKSVLACS